MYHSHPIRTGLQDQPSAFEERTGRWAMNSRVPQFLGQLDRSNLNLKLCSPVTKEVNSQMILVICRLLLKQVDHSLHRLNLQGPPLWSVKSITLSDSGLSGWKMVLLAKAV